MVRRRVEETKHFAGAKAIRAGRDLEGVADTLRMALAMSPIEQRERMRSLRSQVAEFNVYRWAGRMLLDATRLRQRERLQVRLAGRTRRRLARTMG